jgi:hypothetical protein
VTPKITCDKDRGKEQHRGVEAYPWFWGWDGRSEDFRGGRAFDGNRHNHLHYQRAVKLEARNAYAAPTTSSRR